MFLLVTYIKVHLSQEENELIFFENSVGHEDQGQNRSQKSSDRIFLVCPPNVLKILVQFVKQDKALFVIRKMFCSDAKNIVKFLDSFAEGSEIID